MKVLDLACSQGHLFEGWFASEDDFAGQKVSGALVCPLCGDSSVSKRLSAPRLSLRSRPLGSESELDSSSAVDHALTLQAAWMEIGRRIVANTENVGNQFAHEARKIHYGEVPERGIRGQITASEAESLLDEGIAVQSFQLPESAEQPLQ